MAEKIGDAILELRTDVTKLVKGMEDAKQKSDSSMKKMETRAQKFAKFMKGAAALGGVVLAFNAIKKWSETWSPLTAYRKPQKLN